MTSIPLPATLAGVLLLLPGYLILRVAFYVARRTGPVDWPEYEKTAWSLIGSIAVLSGASIVAPEQITIEPENNTLVLETTINSQEYFQILLVSIIAGSFLGLISLYSYKYLFGLTRSRSKALIHILQATSPPVPVRISTSKGEFTGYAQLADDDANIVVLRQPRKLMESNEAIYRKSVGEHLYLDPESIENVIFGKRFNAKGKLERVVDKIRRRIDERGTEGETSIATGPTNPSSSETLKVSDKSVNEIEDEDKFRGTGVVQNISSKDLSFVQVRVDIKNENGVILETRFDSFEDLEKDDSWEFEVIYERESVSEDDCLSVYWYTNTFF